MFPDRMSRVSSLMQSEISEILADRREFLSQQTGGALITVTRVEVKRDLSEAQVYFSWTMTAPSPEGDLKVRQALDSLVPEVMKGLSRRVHMKRLPRLVFEHDHSFESADRVYAIFKHLEKENTQQERRK